jgi:hypothetical protein
MLPFQLPRIAILLLTTACSASDSRPQAAGSPRRMDSLGLVEAATRAYTAELAAMSAYARAECQECPAQAPLFLAGSRHAFDLATRLYPQDPRAFLGLANVLYSSSFRGEGEPVDSALHLAQQAAETAVALASTDSVRAVAESLLARIKGAY